MTRTELINLSDTMEVTLDGKPAIIAGRAEQFMTVVALHTGINFKWSDKAIGRVLTTRSGKFIS